MPIRITEGLPDDDPLGKEWHIAFRGPPGGSPYSLEDEDEEASPDGADEGPDEDNAS